jgi:hypothetical protein
LSKDESELKQIINNANGINLGEKGNNILDIMHKISGIERLKPGEVILQSLFSPHRQMDLPTCTICSLINRYLHNHPERLVEMYSQILSGDDFHMPSGYLIRQQSINVEGAMARGAVLIGAMARETMSMGTL